MPQPSAFPVDAGPPASASPALGPAMMRFPRQALPPIGRPPTLWNNRSNWLANGGSRGLALPPSAAPPRPTPVLVGAGLHALRARTVRLAAAQTAQASQNLMSPGSPLL